LHLPGYIDTPMTRGKPLRMPFLMSPASRTALARAIAARRRLVVIPWQMRWWRSCCARWPGWLYDRLAGARPTQAADVRLT